MWSVVDAAASDPPTMCQDSSQWGLHLLHKVKFFVGQTLRIPLLQKHKTSKDTAIFERKGEKQTTKNTRPSGLRENAKLQEMLQVRLERLNSKLALFSLSVRGAFTLTPRFHRRSGSPFAQAEGIGNTLGFLASIKMARTQFG